MDTLKADAVDFEYLKTVPVLKGISLVVNKGELWAIIGKNGSGKSTLLKCMAGLLLPTRGTISVEEKPVASYRSKELAKLIAYVPQATSRSLPPFSVREFVMLGRFPYQGFFALPDTKDREIVEAVLRLTDTDSLAGRALHTLSGGELQRVFLAAAVAQRTGILLLDEPMSFLDPPHQAMVLRSLDRIHEEFGAAIIAVTHDVNVALNRFSHICALVNGSPFFIGTCEKFKENARELLHEIYGISFCELAGCDNRTRYYQPEDGR